MPPRKPGAPVADTGEHTEVLLQVTVSRPHYARLQVLAAERGSSVAAVSKQVFADAMENGYEKESTGE